MDYQEYYVNVFELFFNSDDKGPMVFSGILPYMYLGDIINKYGSANFYIEIKRKED